MDEPGASLVDETLDEHRGCMQAVADVEGCLDRKPDDPPRWVAELKRRLAALRESLGHHFEGEEAGPMFRELPTRHPRLAPRLADLEAEHATMIEAMDRLLEKAGALGPEPETFELRELNARTQLLVANIRRHEAAENEIVVQAYWDEVGVGD